MTGPAPGEWDELARRFGVEIAQIRRDHLISHVLAAIAAGVNADELVFFGGTALSRTLLTQGRLSEDIDLIALASRTEVAAQIEGAVAKGLARSHGRPIWTPALTATRDAQPAVLSVADGIGIQVQLLPGAGYPRWPTEIVDIEQRYSDAPPARLRVLTADAFAAAKMTAWLTRGTPRDLYDLWALAEHGLLRPTGVALFARHGTMSGPLPMAVFAAKVDEDAWQRGLGHQTRLTVTAKHALAVVREAWAAAQEQYHGRT